MDAIVSGLVLGGLYALIALGFVLTFVTTRTLNFALGEFISAAGFLVIGAAAILGAPPAVLIAFAVLAAGAAGAVVERFVVRPFASGEHDVRWLLTTVGLSMLLLNLLQNSQGAATRSLGVANLAGTFAFGPLRVGRQALVIALLAVAVTAVLVWVTRRTTIGAVVRAVAEDRDTVGLMGVNPTVIAVGSYMLAMGIAALAGILWSAQVGVSLDLGATLLVAGFAAAIMGGLDSFVGPLLGGMLYGVTTQVTAYYAGSTLGSVAGLLLLVVILAVRPQGILGRVVGQKV
ncbi:branched-chain amino acid ABC transporter permease [Nitriliruptoraceae bacterium ZYF776]|nr:branched-chain amino acid ABC transporter permease [Profundirhabdus halotolerans]